MNDTYPKKSPWMKLFGSLALIGCCILLFWISPLREWFTLERFISLVEQGRANPWMPIIFYIGFILAILAVPITIFPIMGGVLFDFWIALPLNLLAATSGAWISFQIARYVGRDALESIIKGKAKTIDQWSNKKGFIAVFLLRWLGVPPFTLANYALGLSSVRLRDFWLGTLLGILPWMAFVTYMANSFWQALLTGGREGFQAALIQTLGPLAVVSAGIFGVMCVVYLIKSRVQQVA